MAQAHTAGVNVMERPEAAPVEDFKVAMRSLASTVALVTTMHEGQRSGLAVTAVCSLTMDPPSILVCVNRSSNTHDLIVQSGGFAVNLLSDSLNHRSLAQCFADPKRVGEAKFTQGAWMSRANGSPMLEDGLSSIDCAVVNTVEVGTHTIFIGEVRQVHNNPDKSPLIYANRNFTGVA